MKMLLATTCMVCLLAACDQRTEAPAAPANEVEAAPARTSANNLAPTSIIRPEVAEEVSTPALAPQQNEPLRATIGFGDSGTGLDDAARSQLDALVADARFAGGGPITLRGHSDASGSDLNNLAVSRRRAEAVRDYLISKDVPEDRITVIALGERRPIEPNAQLDGTDYPEGRQRNRRVEVSVDPAPPGPAQGASSEPLDVRS